MGGKSSPPPPDYSGMEALGREQLDFSKRQYAEMKPIAERVANQQLASQDQQMKQAQEYYDYQQNTFRPVERGLVAQAQEYDTEANRERIAAQAAADTARAFGTAEGMTSRNLARRGVGPGSGNAMAMQNQNALSLASARAGAMTGARNQAEQIGYARKLDAVGLGRNLAGASTAAYGAATGAGSAGLSSSMAPGNQYMGGLAQAGQTYGSILNSQTSAYNTAQSQADPFASIIGMGLGGWAGGGFKGSDIRLKQNIERVGTDERTQLPIYEFEYKATPGERFRGVMAHEVEVNFPEAVVTRADGYKAVFYERLGMQMVKV
jgi:hypothetical protein